MVAWHWWKLEILHFSTHEFSISALFWSRAPVASKPNSLSKLGFFIFGWMATPPPLDFFIEMWHGTWNHLYPIWVRLPMISYLHCLTLHWVMVSVTTQISISSQIKSAQPSASIFTDLAFIQLIPWFFLSWMYRIQLNYLS